MRIQTVYSSQLSDDKIRKLFTECRFGKKITCSKCKSGKLAGFGERSLRCRNCWRKVSITAGTWADKSRLPIRFWYEMIWCFVLAHSAHKSGRLFGKDAKVCWKTYQVIRQAIYQGSKKGRQRLGGTVELDESFYGGTFKNLRKRVRLELRRLGLAKRGGGAKFRKQPVFGIFKRNGKVYLELIPEAKAKILLPIITKRIRLGSDIFSDAGSWYSGLVGLGYVHRTVDHGKEEYVNGEVHINGLEGFWGLSKTNMHTYKGIKKKNWLLYLKEMEWRYNNRHLKFNDQVTQIMKLLMTHRKESFVRS